jgi:hypothetical protein
MMSIGVAVAAQAWSVTWRRDSEEELIFRANQYVDAILQYRKEHGNQYPTNLEDLMKLGPRQVRYIRKLFRDPITPGGQWGLLYLMPSGNAIYDPVVAHQAQAQSQSQKGPPDDSVGGGGAGGGVVMATAATTGVTTGGITPIGNLDPNGTGVPVAGGIGGLMTQGGAQGAGRGPLGAGARLNQQRGGPSAGLLPGATGGFPAMGSAGVGALPPPKPKSSSFDEEAPSEPSIGWPIVGVVSRAAGDLNDRTLKIYKGHEKVSEWQFHVFDRTVDVAQPPQGALPGGSAPAFIGPGFGGKGPITGYGPGLGSGGIQRGVGYQGGAAGGGGWTPGSKKKGGMGQQGGGQQGGGQQGGNGQWPNPGGD